MDSYRTLNIEVDPNCDRRQSHTDTRVAELLRDLGASSQSDQSPQALWEACDDASRIAWYLGHLAERDGHGSPAHRRAVLVACLCARTASHHWRDAACEQAVSLTERWAWGDETVTRDDLHAAGDRLRTALHRAALGLSARTTSYAAADVASYAAATRSLAACARRAATNAACAALCVAYDADVDAYDAARTAHLADLADMIRAAVPEVPL